MLPVYDPKGFDSVDLRKYHIRTVKDIIKFQEFVVSRMEECAFVLKKFSTQFATFQSVSQQLQKKLQEQQDAYGVPSSVPTEVKIEKVDETPVVDKQREELLKEVQQALTDETSEPISSDEDLVGDRQSIEYGNYKAVNGKRRIMYWRRDEEGHQKLVAETEVPTDIKEAIQKHFSKEA